MKPNFSKVRFAPIALVSVLFLSVGTPSVQASDISRIPNVKCVFEDDCIFLPDYDTPQFVMGERVQFATCISRPGRFKLEFQSNWSGSGFAKWFVSSSGTSSLNTKSCNTDKPYFIVFKFTVSKKTTSLGRVEYRVKVGSAAPLGKWVGATYATAAEAKSGSIPGVPATISLTQPITDLQGFIDKNAQSVVTVSCNGSQGSGVSVPFTKGETSLARGFQSMIITNEHVIYGCLTLANLDSDVVVTVFHKGIEYVGYALIYPSWNDVNAGIKPDLAAVYTTALVPQSSYFDVPTPKLGDTVVAVGSAGGVPNVTTRGEIAGVTSKKIITTAAAGHGSSGGGLFNSRGQLLGFITAGNGNLVEVTPITELCSVIFNCATSGISFVR